MFLNFILNKQTYRPIYLPHISQLFHVFSIQTSNPNRPEKIYSFCNVYTAIVLISTGWFPRGPEELQLLWERTKEFPTLLICFYTSRVHVENTGEIFNQQLPDGRSGSFILQFPTCYLFKGRENVCRKKGPPSTVYWNSAEGGVNWDLHKKMMHI